MTKTTNKIAGTIKAGIIAALTLGTAAFGSAQTANAFISAPSGLNTVAATTTVEKANFRGGRRGFRGSRGFRGNRGFRGGRGFRSSRGFRSNRGFRGRGFNRGFKGHHGFKHHGFKGFGYKF